MYQVLDKGVWLHTYVHKCMLKARMFCLSLCRPLSTHRRVTLQVITGMRRCGRAVMALRRVRCCVDQTVLTTSTQRALHTAELNPHIFTGPETGMEVWSHTLYPVPPCLSEISQYLAQQSTKLLVLGLRQCTQEAYINTKLVRANTYSM